jgi:hypothetical protein
VIAKSNTKRNFHIAFEGYCEQLQASEEFNNQALELLNSGTGDLD